MLQRLLRAGLVLFFVLWTGVILLEYYFQNPWHGEAIAHFQYSGWLFLVLLVGAGASWLWHQARPKPSRLKLLNGLTLFLASWLVVLIVSAFYAGKVDLVEMGSAGAGRLTFLYIGTVAGTYLVLGTCYVLGHLITQLFPLPLQGMEKAVLTLGIGIMGVVTLLFFLGSLHLLTAWVLAPLFLVIILLNLPGAAEYVRFTLLRPLPLSADLNPIGIFSFWLLFIFVSLNCLQIIRPIPIGADSMALYMRLPSLINDYNGLVQGYSVYNWSLLMSLGFVLFDNVPVVLSLGYVGGVLSLLALYALARRWLNANHALLVLLMFYTLPMVNFHSYQDMKIDLGMLFISLCIVILLSNWIRPVEQPPAAEPAVAEPEPEPEPAPRAQRKSKAKTKTKGRRKAASSSRAKGPFSLLPVDFFSKLGERWQSRAPAFLQGQALIIWLGLFTGFALGTKLTTLFIFFPLLTVLWYVRGNVRMMLAVLALGFFAVLLLGLDRQSGLRQFHLGVGYMQWGLAAAGLVLLAWEGLRNRRLLWEKVRMSILFSLFFILPMLPWLGKNYSETRQLSSQGLLFGKTALPAINVNTLEKNYQKQQP